MRAGWFLIATWMMACADRPGAGPRVVPPPVSRPSQQTNVFDEIDSAKRATASQEQAIDDPRAQQGLLDSLARARSTAVADTLRRVKQPPTKEQR